MQLFVNLSDNNVKFLILQIVNLFSVVSKNFHV